MMKKRIWAALWALCLCALWLPAMAADGSDLFSKKDQTLADPAKATELTLTDAGVDITEGGVYRLTGSSTQGGIRIALSDEDEVWLLLDGVDVTNPSGAALRSSGCKKLIVTLAEGSQNALRQGEQTPQGEDDDAAIFSRDDLTINGTGALTVTGEYKDGVNCRDSLRIVSGQLTVTAVDDGLVGKDEVSIGGGTVTVTAQGGDAIKSTNSEDAERGFVAIAGGVVTATAGGGHTGTQANSSQKGVKAYTSLAISGGEITVDSADDALHATDVTISGGVLVLSSGDDGVHADNALTVSGGEVDVRTSYEGLEGTDITLSGGAIRIQASDDGINGAGGDSATQESGGWGAPGRFGRDMFSASTGTLTISGGTIYVNASGDGVDVNGDLAMSGGELYVRGPVSSMNGALDYDGAFTLTGGTVVAVGASGMAQGVNAPSVPGAVAYVQDGGALSVLDAAGQAIVTFSAEGTYEHVVVYSDRLTDGESYTLQTGVQSQSITASTEATGGGFGGVGGGFGGGGGGRGGSGGGRKGGGTPPERPDGTAPEWDGTAPERPEGMWPDGGQTGTI